MNHEPRTKNHTPSTKKKIQTRNHKLQPSNPEPQNLNPQAGGASGEHDANEEPHVHGARETVRRGNRRHACARAQRGACDVAGKEFQFKTLLAINLLDSMIFISNSKAFVQ